MIFPDLIKIVPILIPFKQRSLAATKVNGISDKFVKTVHETSECLKLEIADAVEKYANKF